MIGAFQQLAVGAFALLAWWGAEEIGGSGLIAAFVAGLALAIAAREVAADSLELTEEVGQLLALLVFFGLGTVALDALGDAPWETFAFAVLVLTVLRMLPVAIALRGTGLDRATVAYMGWFGPRGLASLLLALDPRDRRARAGGIGRRSSSPSSSRLLISVFAHGATAAPLTDRLARRSTL